MTVTSDQQQQLQVHDTDQLWDLMMAASEAAMMHEGQVDKAGHPYLLHVLHVARECAPHGPRVMTVALLHDIVEDTDMELESVLEGFGPDVAQAVDAITKRDGEAYPAYLKRVEANPWARLVKMADLRHNLSRVRGSISSTQRTKYETALARLEAA